ncbi:uncharacterized protein K02A2.6-like [Armigeres subalbatus]|uniref:uncharacterized protein K02A2.6-like n=1 Tax=Armigeres subalbatus TaxID=124917 RepID=UPI002ED6ABBE
MSEMLAGIEGVIVYIDDIVIAGSTIAEHDARLAEVLEVLKENNVKLNDAKCLYRVKELEILGFKVDALGISPSNDKVEAIRTFRQPETKEEARSFLGLVNFVGHFIPNLSTRSEPLRQYIRGEVSAYGEEQRKAFDDLRNELSRGVHKLGFYDPKDVTEMYVDASPVGLGAVLVQRDKSKIPRVISFASKGLTPAEKVYPQTQREALAVVWAVEKFYLYLFGLHFTVFTDHKTLEYIYGGKHRDGRRACSRAESWALRLLPFDFEVKHIPGVSNISDILSRLCPASASAFADDSAPFLFAIGDNPLAISLDEIIEETRRDEMLIAVTNALQTDEWPKHLFRYQAFRKELGIIKGVIVRDERIILPDRLRTKALDIAHRGHPGIVTMRRILREKVWWPSMDRDVTNRVQECAGCATVRNEYPPEPMMRKEMPERAWQEIAVDFFTAKECATFLVVVDYFSRFLQVIEMKSTNASKTIEALEEIFSQQTYPETIRSDNGPPFSSEEFSRYCSQHNIKLIRTIPYWPQMNGLVERQNQGILRTLRIAKATKTDWRKALKDYVFMYNTSPHSVTDKAPMELLMGRPVKNMLPSLRTEPRLRLEEDVRERDAIRKMQGKLYADERRHAKASEIEVEDTVMMRNYVTGKLEPKFRIQLFTVIKKTGNDTIIANEEGLMYRRCITHLRKWPTSRSTESETELAPSSTDDVHSPSKDCDTQSSPVNQEQPTPIVPEQRTPAKRTLKRPYVAAKEQPKRSSRKIIVPQRYSP